MDLGQGKFNKPTDESSDEEKEKFREIEIVAMNIIVDGVKDNLIPYIPNINFAQELYEDLSKLFTIKNIVQIASLKNETRTIKMINDDTISTYFVRISIIIYANQEIDEFINIVTMILVMNFQYELFPL